jgi:hypothetical protein
MTDRNKQLHGEGRTPNGRPRNQVFTVLPYTTYPEYYLENPGRAELAKVEVTVATLDGVKVAYTTKSDARSRSLSGHRENTTPSEAGVLYRVNSDGTPDLSVAVVTGERRGEWRIEDYRHNYDTDYYPSRREALQRLYDYDDISTRTPNGASGVNVYLRYSDGEPIPLREIDHHELINLRRDLRAAFESNAPMLRGALGGDLSLAIQAVEREYDRRFDTATAEYRGRASNPPQYRPLFCYGSNNLKQLSERVGADLNSPQMRPIPAASLHKKRVFRGYSNNWGGGTASLETSRSRPAYGFIVKLTDAQLDILDRYEGVGRPNGYKRITTEVETYGADGRKLGPVLAIAYVHTNTTFNKPSQAYLEAVAKTIGTCWDINGVRDIKVE